MDNEGGHLESSHLGFYIFAPKSGEKCPEIMYSNYDCHLRGRPNPYIFNDERVNIPK